MKRDQKSQIKQVIVTLLYLSIFTSVFLTSNEKDNQEIDIIKIGVISPSNSMYKKYQYMSNIAQEKINTHFNQSELGYQAIIEVRNAGGTPSKAHNITKLFNNEGVKRIVGHSWNSQLNASLEYAMENNMIVVSPSANSPKYALIDKCYRLLPDDSREAKAIAEIITIYGIDSVILLQKKGNWGRQYAEEFLWELRKNGGDVIEWIEYNPDNTLNITFTLEKASMIVDDTIKVKGKKKTGVFLISLNETSQVLIEAEKYAPLMNVTWFGTETTTLNPSILRDSGNIAAKVGLIGPVNTHIYNEDFLEINQDFYEKFGEPLSFKLANVYDGCWLQALTSVSNPSSSSDKIIETASTYYGITGPLEMNEYGDRSWIRYYFYGYYNINGQNICLRTGRYTRLENSGHKGSSIFHSPFDVIYDNFPFYLWEKDYESK